MRRRTALPLAVIAALLLAGCSSGFVGESWQCPLAEGGSCDSVAAADPAVPDTAGRTVLAEPLWRERNTRQENAPPARGPGQAVETSCETACDGVFDPFAWLARLFGGADGGDRAAARETKPGLGAAPTSEFSPVTGNTTVEPDSALAAPDPANAKPWPEEPTAALPAEPDAAEVHADAGDLRTGEVVARIWIAPFVDADGVYREASHVRVVLEPARWRLGR